MWKTKLGTCDRCGSKDQKLEPAFGKWICSDCKDSRPRKGTGNAGLTDTGITTVKPSTPELQLLRVPKSDGLFGKLFFEHYPGSKGIPGRSLCYLVYKNHICVGIIGVNSPPRKYKKFRDFFNDDDETYFVNNNVFRLINHEKNLGTKVLKLFRETVRKDYDEKYPQELHGIVTFVEPPRNGAVYKADNWIYLGKTAGRRMRRDSNTWEKVFTQGKQKLIFAYKYK